MAITTTERLNKLTTEIGELIEESELLRDQIYALECKEAKIAEKVVQKQRQFDVIKYQNN